MDVLKDLLSLLAVFPHHLGTILICSGAVLVCSGIIFWRPATDRSQREQTPLPPRRPARYRPDLGSGDGRERRPSGNNATAGDPGNGLQGSRTGARPRVR